MNKRKGLVMKPEGSEAEALPELPEIIEHLRQTDPTTWWAGPTFRSPDEGQHCVLSHVFERWGRAGLARFEDLYSTSYVIGAGVNDTPSVRYPQQHPKDRCIAYLEAMLRGEEPTTFESMEAEYRAYIEEREEGSWR